MAKRDSNNGFTIIEVVIVLALAAFIFTIVFFAVPQLQRSLRDNQRQSDINRVMAALLEFKAANDGDFPYGVGGINAFESSYFANDNNFSDPSTGARYNIEVATTNTDYPVAGEIHIRTNATCVSDTYVRPAGAHYEGSNIAIMVQRDSDDSYICRDNV